ncbi:MAG: hypothetical protein SGPRY_009279 [Prymnesium sp.]
MDKFEQSFEDMDVRSEYVEQAMNSTTTAAMPEEDVEDLMQRVADEHGLQMAQAFKTAGSESVPGAAAASGNASQVEHHKPEPCIRTPTAQPALSASAEDDLEERLRKLRS